ncbi:MAG: hypothetical protein IJ770_00980 [Alphaproteobacteria bacterium]|nr:hypothetical protein [Alphaproteobacteria bacterium]
MRYLFFVFTFCLLNIQISEAKGNYAQPADAEIVMKLINSGNFLKSKHIEQLKKLAQNAGYDIRKNSSSRFYEKAEIYNNFVWREDMEDIAPTAYLIAQKYKFIVPATNISDQEILMQKLYTQLELLSKQSVSSDDENLYPREVLIEIWNRWELKKIANKKEFSDELI